MEKTNVDPRDDSMIIDISGPGQSEVEQGSTQNTTSNAPDAPKTSFSNPALEIEERSGPAPTTIHKSISPNATSGGFPTFEHTFNSNPSESPGIRGMLSSGSSSHRSEKEEFQDIFSELMTGTEHEIAFLTRHFSEVIGPW